MQEHPHCFLHEHSMPEWHNAITTNARPVLYKKGAQIFGEGDPVTGFCFIHTGRVKVHKHWGDEGRELIIKFAGPGDVLGHRGMGKDQIYPVSATAIEPVSGCFVTPEFFRASLRVNPELAYQTVLFYADELQRAEQGMRDMAHMNVKSRIAKALLQLEELFGTDRAGAIRNSLSREDIASFAGTTYETLFKTFNDWTAEGLIAAAGKEIILRDKKKLQNLVR